MERLDPRAIGRGLSRRAYVYDNNLYHIVHSAHAHAESYGQFPHFGSHRAIQAEIRVALRDSRGPESTPKKTSGVRRDCLFTCAKRSFRQRGDRLVASKSGRMDDGHLFSGGDGRSSFAAKKFRRPCRFPDGSLDVRPEPGRRLVDRAAAPGS